MEAPSAEPSRRSRPVVVMAQAAPGGVGAAMKLASVDRPTDEHLTHSFYMYSYAIELCNSLPPDENTA